MIQGLRPMSYPAGATADLIALLTQQAAMIPAPRAALVDTAAADVSFVAELMASCAPPYVIALASSAIMIVLSNTSNASQLAAYEPVYDLSVRMTRAWWMNYRGVPHEAVAGVDHSTRYAVEQGSGIVQGEIWQVRLLPDGYPFVLNIKHFPNESEPDYQARGMGIVDLAVECLNYYHDNPTLYSVMPF